MSEHSDNRPTVLPAVENVHITAHNLTVGIPNIALFAAIALTHFCQKSDIKIPHIVACQNNSANALDL